MKKEFWPPEITSQFLVCPVPFHMDTYRGCMYNCLYCFARTHTLFSRKNKEKKAFEYLVGNDHEKLRNWISRVLNTEDDYTKANTIALKERMPIRIGGMSDPCPTIERKTKITYNILKVFEEFDYPLKIQTKNPGVLAEFSNEFESPNWVIGVSLMSVDKDFIKVCEPNSPPPKARLKAIEQLCKEDKKVMVKVQPAIYPKILEDLPDLISAIHNSGAFGVSIEGLKLRVMMPEEEQERFKVISDFLGYDLREQYKKEKKTNSDFELRNKKKLEYIKVAHELCQERDMKFYVADNDIGKYGDSLECCGTEFLQDYKIWGCSSRSIYFDNPENCSRKLEQCKDVSFFFNNKRKRYRGKTLKELADKQTRKLKNKFFQI